MVLDNLEEKSEKINLNLKKNYGKIMFFFTSFTKKI